MQSTKIKRMLKKYADIFKALEQYDKTRELPFQRKRIDITLSVGVINKLKKIKEKTGMPISKIIEKKLMLDRMEFSKETLRNIAKSEKEIREGKIHKWEDFKKELKINV